MSPSRRLGPRTTLLLSLFGASLIAIPALFGGDLRVLGQTAGPIATRPVPIIAGPSNGGVATAPEPSVGQPAPAAGSAIQPNPAPAVVPVAPRPDQPVSPPAASGAGQGVAAAGAAGGASAPAQLNLTAADGVNLIAGQSLLYVPPESASCAAAAQLSYTPDEAIFSARCSSGTAVSLSQPATLCMEPTGQIVAAALGNYANLSVTADQPLPSRVAPNGALVCASVPGAGTYTLSVTAKNRPPEILHMLPKGAKVQLPAVGAGGLLHFSRDQS